MIKFRDGADFDHKCSMFFQHMQEKSPKPKRKPFIKINKSLSKLYADFYCKTVMMIYIIGHFFIFKNKTLNGIKKNIRTLCIHAYIK